MSRYKLTLEYNGTNLIGWQENPGGVSVQSLVQDAIFKFSGQNVNVYSAGRTDAGVHALGMIAHFDLDAGTDGNIVHRAINFYLKKTNVIVLDCKQVSDDFHARFSCILRNYKYIILNRAAAPILEKDLVWWKPVELNIDAMKLAANKLIGNHDFTSFRASECQAKSPIKTMDKIEIKVVEEQFGKRIIIEFSARSFLHHQVRNIVGTLVEIGLGKPYDIDKILAAKDRSAAGPTAPASGLYFVSAGYATND
ncbi:MAG: tRNA pseudouridine(38-40) synthase TruA [Alphaproteobacteria bacterium]|nr:tRNA pseudouridine(38-40) synthase TruA [Alphaproteobacteria bacterium]MBN2675503.1 tRNA pseudouridine(38-40) synthase TruA [Alphaproteobacteria bacterium]